MKIGIVPRIGAANLILKMTQQQLDKLSKGSYLKYSLDDNCIEETIDARKLLCTARFDFYGILIYIDQKVRGVQDLTWAKNIYKERTSAMTGHKLSEPGSDEKNSFDDFISVLDTLIDEFQNDRFDIDRTLVPVDKDYVPMDGAHRVTCAAYFGKQVKVLRFPDREYQFKGYQYLKHELLPTLISDYMALESAKWHNDLFVFFLWPQAHSNPEKLKKAQEMIYVHTDVMYDVEYKFSYEAIRNLLIQIYGHMDWLGNIDNEFQNVLMKVDEVWSSNGKVQLIITRGESCEYITNLKAQIRDMFGIGLSSCHSTDNMRETRLALNALLNPLSREFLERAKPTAFKSSYKLVERFKEIVKSNLLPMDNFILDSSMVLAIFGAREAQDLDFYCLPETDLSVFLNVKDVEEHDDSQKAFYDKPVTDYILSPEHYFVFNEVKFMSLENLKKFKEKRYAKNHDIKDKHDIELIQTIGTGVSSFQKWKTALVYSCKRHWRKTHDFCIEHFIWRRREYLEKIGFYKPLRIVFNIIKRH
ncbi:hypothetical protein L6472_10190 [Prevotella sp. E13-17]|uniref:hypothetical protein n=1 Tax=Prevotella sp. E13-17 TaxID=2913616 RepID=UPI001EDB3542|nr:hypothetical protein [Prevotella sp. E13-17]UKK50389.1 hypothetical protein L6472_10190 [Prevotella sp. E13-17]